MKTNSKFSLFMQTDLSSSDFKVLSLLYQPLIGIEAYAIYTTFYNLARKSEEIPHHIFFDMLNIKQNDFIKYREKLEAIGLLETYEKTTSLYLYVIKPPFTAKQFLVDTFLGTYLESEIGEKNLKFLLEIFKVNKPDISECKNITKSFDDLYEFNTNELLKVNVDLEGRNGNTTKLIRDSIDYNLFVEKLPRALKTSNLFNDNFKQKIVQLAYVYQYDVDDLVSIYENAHKGRKNITIEQINLQAKKYYEQKNKELFVKEKIANEDEALSIVPFRVIVDKYVTGDVINKSMALDTINDFISQNNIDPGILNVLVLFILKNKNGVLPPVNYLNKVWESWRKKGVQTVSDAMQLQREADEYRKNNAYSKNNTKKEANEPDWLDEYMKDLFKKED